jgi:uncharacterized protein (DUF1330 family)
MPAYLIGIRNRTDDPDKLKTYNELTARMPIDKFEVVAYNGAFEMLEGPAAEAVLMLRFPTTSDALAWYNSEEYQKALPYRLSAGDYRVLIIEGQI